MMRDLFGAGSAVFSQCEKYRYRLDRDIAGPGSVFAFVGVNPSTADAERDDHTCKKWNGFTVRWGASRYVVGNVFGYRATDVKSLARVVDPVGPSNDEILSEIISDADIVVPCWGSRAKLPKSLHPRIDTVRDLIVGSGKPVMAFGITSTGDPTHPQMLGYDTKLIEYR